MFTQMHDAYLAFWDAHPWLMLVPVVALLGYLLARKRAGL